MEVEFANDGLDRLETDRDFTAGLSKEIVRGFRKAMQAIRAATDERDLYVTTTIVDTRGRKSSCCTRSPFYHAVLSRVSCPGGVVLRPWGRVLAQ